VAPTTVELDDDLFPHWARIAAIVIPLFLAMAICVQRDAVIPPSWVTVVAFAAAVPWLLEPFGIRLPPLLSITVVLGAVLILVIGDPVKEDTAPFFLVFLCAYRAMAARKWEGTVAMGGSIGLLVGLEVAGRYSGSLPYVIGIVISWAWGFAIRAHTLLVAQLRAAQAGLAERAAADERQRIAREIHDVIAHSLAVTMLHLTGARLALRRDPEEAEEALLEAERLGRESLAEIRRTVGLLAPEGTGTAAPMPAATDIAQLVHEFEAAGLDVDFELTGDPGALPPATGLGLYRVAQESLSNVVRHAPGTHTTMSLRVGDEVVSMHVRNRLAHTSAAPATDGGLGVRGMQERVTLLGGELRAGSDGDAWCVDVELPRTVEPA
jgi:signal transduction histidine kinase